MPGDTPRERTSTGSALGITACVGQPVLHAWRDFAEVPEVLESEKDSPKRTKEDLS